MNRLKPTLPLIAVTASLLLWTGWNYTRALCHPYADLQCGFFTDHFSHVGLTRLFVEQGPDIYRYPRGTFGRELTPSERAALPDDLEAAADLSRVVQGWPREKPFTSSWLDIPSFYPPGSLVLYSPAAAVYSFTDLSFSETNRFTIQLLLIYAHITLLLIFVLRAEPETRAPSAFALIFSYVVIVRWTLEGFYDAAAIAPLLFTPIFLKKNDGMGAVATFVAGSFIHFRSIFYLPWGAAGLGQYIAGKQWRVATRGRVAAAGGTIIMCAATGAVFLAARSGMAAHRLTNPFNPASDAFDPARWLLLGLIILTTGVFLVLARAWEELAMLLWFSVVVRFLPEVNMWNAVALIPWLVAPVRLSRPRMEHRVRDVRAAVVILLALAVFGDDALTLEWVRRALEAGFPGT